MHRFTIGNQWVNILWEHEEGIVVPPDALLIPGVKLSSTMTGSKLEVPINAAHLPQLRALTQHTPRPVMTPKSLAGLELYLHQEQGVHTAMRNGSLLLGDEMGLGKTAQAAVFAREMRGNSFTLIIGPRYLRETWRAEIERLFPGEKFVALSGLHGDTSKLETPIDGAKWVFCHPDILKAWWPKLQRWHPKTGILDEAHLFKNLRSQRGKIVEIVMATILYKILLTGTPIPNRLSEFLSLLSLTTGPWTWGTYNAFLQRYAGAIHSGYGWVETSPTQTEELQERLSGVYLRRTKTEVGLELPPLRRQIISVDLDEASHTKLSEVLSGYDLRALLRALFEARLGRDAISWVNRIRKVTSRAKLATTVSLANSLLEQAQSVVIFTWEREMAEKIAAKLDNAPFVVHGAHVQEHRDAMVREFQSAQVQSNYRARAIVATYGSLSVGVTLHAASAVIMHDLDYVPSTLLQAEARVHRIGLKHSVMSYWVIASDTIDEAIARIITRKAPAIGVSGDGAPNSLAEMLGKELLDAESIQDWIEWSQRG